MKKNMFGMIAIVAIASLVVSCEKDIEKSAPDVQEPLSVSEDLQIDTTKDVSQSAVTADIYQNFESSLKSTGDYGYEYPNTVYTWMLERARSESDILTYFFKLDVRYKNSYQHIKQVSDECSWTSYVIAAGCVANVKSCYPVTKKQVNYVRDKCEYLMRKTEDPHTYAMQVTSLEKFSQQYDASSRFKVCSQRPAKRFETIKMMLTHINNYHSPFLVIGTYYYTNGKKGGHYLVVHSIDWRGSASNSTIYFTDCSRVDQGSLSSNLRTMNFSTFLDQMIILGQLKNYNMLFVMPK